jgi:hypothetical protein
MTVEGLLLLVAAAEDPALVTIKSQLYVSV